MTDARDECDTQSTNDSRAGRGRWGRLLEQPRRARRVPAGQAGAGITFVRRDLPGCPRISAAIANRTESPLRTILRSGDAGVDMVEHIMAALAGLQSTTSKSGPTSRKCRAATVRFPLCHGPAKRRHRRAKCPAGHAHIIRVYRLGDEEPDRGPAFRIGPDHCPVRIRLRQRESNRPAIAGDPAFAAVLHLNLAAAERSCWSAKLPSSSARTGHATVRDLLVFERRRADRNTLPFPTSACDTKSSI